MTTNNFSLDNGEVRLMINGDESRVIVFNPTDLMFAERFYTLLDVMKSTLAEYQARGSQLAGDDKKDENGLPANLREQIRLQIDLCDLMREKIDGVFGAGTSQAAFGETRNLEVLKQFFNGILPYFQKVRADKVAQYTSDASAKRNKRKR